MCVLGVAFALFLLAGYSKRTVVEVVMPGDEEWNCGQLENVYAEAERFKEEVKGEKGLTGGNTARALLFWPAIVET